MSNAGKREVGYSVQVSGWNWVVACGRGGGFYPPSPFSRRVLAISILSLAISSP